MQFIKKSADPKPGSLYIFECPDGPKISLSEGPSKFYETISYLDSLYYSLPVLKQSEDLSVKVPRNINNWTKREIFADLLGEKKANLAEHYTNYQFHFDIGSYDPVISAIIQIVDDNYTFKGQRRNNILNEECEKVGISSYKIGKKNCVYVLFAKDAEIV